MNKRTMDIIEYLCSQGNGCTIRELAQKYQVSTRTIRNDLNAVNEVLTQGKLTPLELQRGGVVRCAPDFREILDLVAVRDYYSYKLSPEERVLAAAEQIVQSSGYITLAAVADTLYVSRTTVIDDLEDIRRALDPYGIQLTSSPSKGQRVVGPESAKRRFLLRQRQSWGQTRRGEETDEQRSLLFKIIREQEHVHNCSLDDASFRMVQDYLEILLQRTRQGEFVEEQDAGPYDRYLLAQNLLRYVCQYCQITITENEIRFLAGLLDRCRFFRRENYNQDIIKVQLITRQFITSISEELGEALNDDYVFFENLSSHLEAILIQKDAYFPENEVVREISQRQREVHEAVCRHLDVLTRYCNRPLRDVEIMYITVHVCAALERRRNNAVSFHVAVVCHSGVGTSQLLVENLRRHFNFHIIGALSSHEASDLTEQEADFIISTIPLDNCLLEHIVVSPILTDEDFIRVGNKIDQLRDTRALPNRSEGRQHTAAGLMQRIRPVLEEMIPQEAELVCARLGSVVRDYFRSRRNREREEQLFTPCLRDLLPASHIQLDVECADWRDAVRKSAQKLLDSGYIESRYVEAMIQNIEENGPYVVLSPGFAIPHEGLEQGSVKVGMNLIRLAEPVYFGVEDYDPVEFVCCLSAVDHRSHLKAFFRLVNLLKESDFKAALRSAGTPEEASAVVARYEAALCP